MKVNDDLLVLELSANLMGGPTLIHPVVIVDEAMGLTLVDAGLPGMADAIGALLSEQGLKLSDIKRVIITHHDLDHIGSVPAVVEASGAQVWAPEREIPFLEGREWPQKMPTPQQADQLLADPNVPQARKEMIKQMSGMKPVTLKVDRALKDGEVLPMAGGVRVVTTPGHTFGHASLYLERHQTLITGDALSSSAGQLSGPFPAGTADMKTAGESVNKLAGLDVQTIVTYHGGVVSEEASGQLKQVAGQMAAAN
ncbi:MBL fold metallo-hydrolase [Deinococcus alpinitundrae]|uniref:MBL fold metallo-hydrolase n=1 Tax=Deinococcus alpinitundrae TaxID=468913 RepID=UPI001ED90FAD|nr:MBL fold metallo-hydrolase [Deinococcus alpinitundrae]